VKTVGPLPFLKGHGTGNDFVLIPDLDDECELSADQVRALCDRHFGIGGDGLIRIARDANTGFLVMDYRNADGSLAEMCGNGARVFIRALQYLGIWAGEELEFETRAGRNRGIVHPDGSISIDMGPAHPVEAGSQALVHVGDRSWPMVGVRVPNPHAIVFIDHLNHAGLLHEPPVVIAADAFPDGVNVEFVVARGDRHVAMRVHERGVGETLSCGTGACAVVWAASRRDGGPRTHDEWQVDVPGGTVFVREDEQGHLLLRGPAVIFAQGQVHIGV
jgi:diaminopimelate epimerase